MSSAGFEPAIPTSEWPQTHASDCAAIGKGEIVIRKFEFPVKVAHKQHNLTLVMNAAKLFVKSLARITTKCRLKHTCTKEVNISTYFCHR